MAYGYLGRYEEGMAICQRLLGYELADANTRFVAMHVASLTRNSGGAFHATGSLLRAGRCFALATRVELAAGRDRSAIGPFRHAELERNRGRVTEALTLLELADASRFPPTFRGTTGTSDCFDSNWPATPAMPSPQRTSRPPRPGSSYGETDATTRDSVLSC